MNRKDLFQLLKESKAEMAEEGLFNKYEINATTYAVLIKFIDSKFDNIPDVNIKRIITNLKKLVKTNIISKNTSNEFLTAVKNATLKKYNDGRIITKNSKPVLISFNKMYQEWNKQYV